MHLVAQTKSVPFRYVTNQDEVSYNPNLTHKTLALGLTEFVVLGKNSEADYTIEKYNNNLNLNWVSPVNLGLEENIEAFGAGSKNIYLIIRKISRQEGSQLLFAVVADRKTGKISDRKLLFEAPLKARRVGVTLSNDGTKIMLYQYVRKEGKQFTGIRGVVYDESFTLLKEQLYDCLNLNHSFTPELKIDNQGNQYLAYITDSYRKLIIRKYTPRTEVYGELSTQMGGFYNGLSIYMFDHLLRLDDKGTPHFAAFCVEDSTMQYYSLKMAKFNFTDYTISMAEEFKFSPEYLTKLASYRHESQPDELGITDTYLSDMIFTPENDVLLIAEKKYSEEDTYGGHIAKEMLIYRYNQYMGQEWQTAVWKDQYAGHFYYYSGLSYSAAYYSNTLQLVSFEKQNSQNDLYMRKVSGVNGELTSTQPLRTANPIGNTTMYLHDFTTWLDEHTLVTVTRNEQQAQLNLVKLP